MLTSFFGALMRPTKLPSAAQKTRLKESLSFCCAGAAKLSINRDRKMDQVSRSERQRLRNLSQQGVMLPEAGERIRAELIAAFNPNPIVLDRQSELAEKYLYHFVKQAWPILEPGTPFVD